MANLFNISRELEEIFSVLEENGGELTPELEARLAITESDFKDKLDNYRKVLTEISNKVDACKAEKCRIDKLIKTRQNAVDRIKKVMAAAVIQFGDKNKNGNSYIDLDTCKISTRATAQCKVKEEFINVVINTIFEKLRELYDEYILDNDDDISLDSMVDIINAELEAIGYTDKINKYDIISTYVNVSVRIPISELFNHENYNLLDVYFKYDDNAKIELESKTSDYKNYITNHDVNLNVAEIITNQTLNIK